MSRYPQRFSSYNPRFSFSDGRSLPLRYINPSHYLRIWPDQCKIIFRLSRSSLLSFHLSSLWCPVCKFHSQKSFIRLIYDIFSFSFSLSLFTRSIRWSLARSLSRPVSLYKVAAVIKLATGSPIVNAARIEWTIAAAVCLLALNAQTAG